MIGSTKRILALSSLPIEQFIAQSCYFTVDRRVHQHAAARFLNSHDDLDPCGKRGISNNRTTRNKRIRRNDDIRNTADRVETQPPKRIFRKDILLNREVEGTGNYQQHETAKNNHQASTTIQQNRTDAISPKSNDPKKRIRQKGGHLHQPGDSKNKTKGTQNPRDSNKKTGKKSTKNRGPSPADVSPQNKVQEVRFNRNSLHIHVYAQPGLEPVLYQELNNLSIPYKIDPPGVQLLHGTLDTVHICQLHLGAARLIRVRLGESFAARALGELRRKVSNIPWSDIVTTMPQRIRVQASKSRLLHTTAIENCIRQGIESQVTSSGGEGQQLVGACLSATMHYDRLQLAFDTLPDHLHQRKYRLETAKAPLREDLAFAMVHMSGWDPDDSKIKFLDPFCGSGTIAIEAACRQMKLAPGRLTSAPLQGTSLYDSQAWEQRVQANWENRVRPEKEGIRIFASDRDEGAIRAATANAKRAGVADAVDFSVVSFSSHPQWNDSHKLAVVSNPPFGKRVRKRESTELHMYQRLAMKIGESNCQALLLTNDTAVWNQGGIQPPLKSVLSTWHGGIAVNALFYTNAGVSEESKSVSIDTVGESEHISAAMV